MRPPERKTTETGAQRELQPPPGSRRFGFAWVFLCVVLALHVTDEAATDFLSVYNPAVQAIRARFPVLPLPTFTFGVWLAGLSVGILLLLSLSPLAFRGWSVAIWLAYPLGSLMFANGLGHIGGSLYLGHLMPGVYSSPLLLAASAFLFACARMTHREHGTRIPGPDDAADHNRLLPYEEHH